MWLHAGFGLPISRRRTFAFARPIRLRRIGARLRLTRICLRRRERLRLGLLPALVKYAGERDTGSPKPPPTKARGV